MEARFPSPVLVTGPTGFIGRHLVRALQGVGPAPILVCRDIGKLHQVYPGYPGRTVHWDLRNPADTHVREAIAEATVAVHAAATVAGGSDFETDIPVLNDNVTFGWHLLTALPSTCRHLVLLSSTAVYGGSEGGPIDETYQTAPEDFYALAKLALEKFFTLYGQERDRTVTVLRISSTYGPGMPRSRAIARFVDAALGRRPATLTQQALSKRNYIHVQDVVKAILLSLASGPAAGGVFNVCASESRSLSEILDVLDSVTGRRIERLMPPGPSEAPALPRAYCVSKAEEAIGFSEGISIDDGLRELYAGE